MNIAVLVEAWMQRGVTCAVLSEIILALATEGEKNQSQDRVGILANPGVRKDSLGPQIPESMPQTL